MLILREIPYVEEHPWHFLYSLPTLESLWISQDAQGTCALSILGGSEDKTSHSPEQPDLISSLTLLRAGGCIRDLLRFLPTRFSYDFVIPWLKSNGSAIMMERLCSYVLVELWKGRKSIAVPVTLLSSSNKHTADIFKGKGYFLVITARKKILSSQCHLQLINTDRIKAHCIFCVYSIKSLV